MLVVRITIQGGAIGDHGQFVIAQLFIGPADLSVKGGILRVYFIGLLPVLQGALVILPAPAHSSHS